MRSRRDPVGAFSMPIEPISYSASDDALLYFCNLLAATGSSCTDTLVGLQVERHQISLTKEDYDYATVSGSQTRHLQYDRQARPMYRTLSMRMRPKACIQQRAKSVPRASQSQD